MVKWFLLTIGLVKNRILRCISKWFLFPSPCQKHQGIFLWYSLWERGRTPGGKTHKNMGAPIWLGPPGIFNSQSCKHWASIIQLQFRFSYPSTGFCRGFCLWVSALVSFNSMYPPVCFSNFGGSDLWPHFSARSKKCWLFFPVSSAFYLLGCSENF